MRKPSPAIVISVVALFFSLTGGGFAAGWAAGGHHALAVRSESATVVLSAAQSDTAKASCPRGMQARDGGFEGAGEAVTMSEAVGRGWWIAAHADPGYYTAAIRHHEMVPWVRAWALCS